MPKIFFDFETRSRADLKAFGAYKYAAHPSTEILCMAYAADDEPTSIWYKGQPCPPLIMQAIDEGWEFHAHNAGFERAVYNSVCVEKLGWPEIPADRYRCTAAKAAHGNHPRKLESAAKQLLPGEGKDMSGNAHMLTMCAPKVKTLANCMCEPRCECNCGCRCEPLCVCKSKKCRCREVCKCRVCRNNCKCVHPWIDDRASMIRLGEYCIQDVDIERKLDKKLPAWPENEIKIWQANERINDRGVPLDRALSVRATKILQGKMESIGADLLKKTDGAIYSGNQNVAIKNYINERGVNTDSIDKENVERILDMDITNEVRDILQFRQISAGSAGAKFSSAVDVMQGDDRGRGLFMYYGAMTGRFASLKTQIQNMKKGGDKNGVFVNALMSDDDMLIDLIYGDQIISEIGKNVRKMVYPGPGYKLLRCDSSQIECRVLHWLCDSEKMLTLFRNDEDPYCSFASMALNRTITKDNYDERQLGKAAVLGLGFGMGAARFVAQAFAQYRLTLNLKFAKTIVDLYRKTNQPVVQFWHRLEKAAKACCDRKITTRVGKLVFRYEGAYMTMELPSGRKIYYYKAKFEGSGRDMRFVYTSTRGERHEWAGGLLCENAVQAVARDTLCHYMQLALARGIDIVAHVHDEAIAQAKDHEAEAHGQLLMECFADQPTWAAGLPCASELTIADRYQ